LQRDRSIHRHERRYTNNGVCIPATYQLRKLRHVAIQACQKQHCEMTCDLLEAGLIVMPAAKVISHRTSDGRIKDVLSKFSELGTCLVNSGEFASYPM